MNPDIEKITTKPKKVIICGYYTTTDELVKQVDEIYGGWPMLAKSLVMQHTDERACYFSARSDVRDEWNTSVLTADEYYWFKLSDKRKDEFRKEIRRNIGRSLL